jgi:hypothetical protein
MYEDDPQYQKLKAIRDSGYTGPLDRDLNKVKIEGSGIHARIVPTERVKSEDLRRDRG